MKAAIVIVAAFASLTVPALASGDGRRDASGRQEYVSDKSGRCAVRPDAELLSVEEVTAKLKEQGYTVRKVERERGCYEVKATNAQGVQVEIYVDPATATIVKRDGRS
jgi:hypothetical protein